MDVINIRSDTQTLPTAAMLDAMRGAELGDDMYGEDPTVNRFEAMAAERVGMEAAMLTISGTMGNLVAMMVHAGPGDEVIIDPDSHIMYYETGGLANVAGLMPMAVASCDGCLDPDEVRAAIRRPNRHYPAPRLLCLENTHNRSGGRVVPVDVQDRLCEIAHEHGLAVHLDGARIFNAALAANVPAAHYTRNVDSLMFCLSKGLSCPLGSVVCGSRAFIDKAIAARQRLGGGMRQAGIIAAAGIVALETMLERLADDHANARVLAEGLNGIDGLSVDMASVQTNMVYADHTGTGLSTMQVIDCLKEAGVLVSARPPEQIRFVINRHHDRAVIDEVVRRVRSGVETGKRT